MSLGTYTDAQWADKAPKPSIAYELQIWTSDGWQLYHRFDNRQDAIDVAKSKFINDAGQVTRTHRVVVALSQRVVYQDWNV